MVSLLPVHSDLPLRKRYALVISRALPIVFGMVSQNVLNLVDTWMVGMTGNASLAAVATGGMVNFLAIAALMGLSVGVQALAARRHGEQRRDQTASSLNSALIVSVIVGAPLTALLVPLSGIIFAHLNPDPEVVSIGSAYLSARLWVIVPASLNLAFRGYWNGTNRSRLYLKTLLVIHAANIILNYVLIFGHFGFAAHGAVGAGIASAIATCLGTLYYFQLGFRHARDNGFLRQWPRAHEIRQVLSLALPTSLQQFLFAGGFTAQFWIIGKLGTTETAAASVLINLMLVVVLPGLALGITATSLVSQSLGQGSARDAYRWGWYVAQVAFMTAAALGLLMWCIPNAVLSPFLHDPQALAVARSPLRVFASIIALDAVGTVLQQALLGAGDNRKVMLVSVICQWGLFLPAAYLLGPGLGYGLLAVWYAHAGYRVVQGGVYVWMWHRRAWTTIRL